MSRSRDFPLRREAFRRDLPNHPFPGNDGNVVGRPLAYPGDDGKLYLGLHNYGPETWKTHASLRMMSVASGACTSYLPGADFMSNFNAAGSRLECAPVLEAKGKFYFGWAETMVYGGQMGLYEYSPLWNTWTPLDLAETYMPLEYYVSDVTGATMLASCYCGDRDSMVFAIGLSHASEYSGKIELFEYDIYNQSLIRLAPITDVPCRITEAFGVTYQQTEQQLYVLASGTKTDDLHHRTVTYTHNMSLDTGAWSLYNNIGWRTTAEVGWNGFYFVKTEESVIKNELRRFGLALELGWPFGESLQPPLSIVFLNHYSPWNVLVLYPSSTQVVTISDVPFSREEAYWVGPLIGMFDGLSARIPWGLPIYCGSFDQKPGHVTLWTPENNLFTWVSQWNEIL